MSRREKLKSKLLDDKKSISWQELRTLLISLGYKEIQGKGSRVKFDNGNQEHIINLHRPHPGNEIKKYVQRLVLIKLKDAELL